MWSVHSNLQLAILVPPCKHKFSHNPVKVPSNRNKSILHCISSSLKDDSPSSAPNQRQLRYDLSEELYGLDVDTPSRDIRADGSEPRSWFGPNGQYIKELPCPSCRGRGYTPCTECGIERSRQDCSLCSGKGLITCQRCLGERVIWEESIDEKPWETARSISPLKVKEDDEVDDLEFNLDTRKKSKRIYRSPPPEVGLKISRSLKSLNAKTGLFSKRMKIIHRDPALHAQRVAAIKKAKQKPAARKHASETLKTFFSDPENRRKRSISMKGVKFFCKNCGREGHRSFYCPELTKDVNRRFKCGICGERGHNRRTCQKPKTSTPKQRVLRQYHCRACGQIGHNRRTCLVKTEVQASSAPTRVGNTLKDSKGHVRKPYQCRVCGEVGHNKRTCRNQLSKVQSDSEMTELRSSLNLSRRVRQPYRCSICHANGHNRRTCAERMALK